MKKYGSNKKRSFMATKKVTKEMKEGSLKFEEALKIQPKKSPVEIKEVSAMPVENEEHEDYSEDPDLCVSSVTKADVVTFTHGKQRTSCPTPTRDVFHEVDDCDRNVKPKPKTKKSHQKETAPKKSPVLKDKSISPPIKKRREQLSQRALLAKKWKNIQQSGENAKKILETDYNTPEPERVSNPIRLFSRLQSPEWAKSVCGKYNKEVYTV